MIIGNEIYWITRLDCFNGLAFALFVVGLGMTVLYYISQCTNDRFPSALRNFGIPFLIIGLLGLTFLPTTKQMCAIKVIPAVVNNERIQNLSTIMIDKAIDWLKDVTKETEKRK